jgi:small-conductance mechanosensitive channel
MMLTRELVILAATALAWFAYAITINDPSGFNPLIGEISRNAALVLSGVAVVRLAALVLIDGLVERAWGIPSTALMRFVVHAVLGITAAALILKYGNDFNITTLLTTSALITVILGLAAQSTVAGLFSGIALQLERNVHPGDVIRVDGRLARVEVVGWRSITVRRTDGIQVVVPNTVVAANPMTLFRLGAMVRSEAMISAPLSVPPGTVIDIVRHAVAGIGEVSGDHPIAVDLCATRAPEGLADYRVRCFARSTIIEEDALAPILRLRVWYAYQRHGIVEPRWPLQPDWAAHLPPTDLARLRPEAAIGHLVSALGGSRRWHGRNPGELEQLARGGRRLLYAPREPILLPRDLDRAVVTLVTGEVLMSGAVLSVPDWIEPAVSAAHDRASALDWDIETLLEVESQLGRAIGPYARLAVRRAAREAADLATLYRQLAVLIGDPAARDAFLANAPRNAVRSFGPGTAFAVRCAGRGRLAAPGGALSARGEVELLAIPIDRLGDNRDALSAAS